MAPLRIVDPNGLYHVFSRGNYRGVVFHDRDHYRKYLALLARVTKRRRWLVLDWCLMPNHFHLLIKLETGGLSEGMRELNGCFSRWSNLRTGRTGQGHLVRNRFGCVDVIRDGHLWSLFSYIPLNPVRARLVERPEEWSWSGFAATIGLGKPQPFHQPTKLLQFFAPDRDQALARYLALVEQERVREGQPGGQTTAVEPLMVRSAP